MAISFTAPTFESTPPEAALDLAGHEAWLEAQDAKAQALATAITALVAAVNGIAAQKVLNGASATGLTGATNYRYVVMSPVTATYGGALVGNGTGTAIMALTASADLLLLTLPM